MFKATQFIAKSLVVPVGIVLGLGGTPKPAKAGPEPFIGELMLVPYNFCPRNYTEAAGQLLPIGNYQALFSLVGTTYGGDGRTTFGLPDLRGRVPVGFGQGPGLSPVKLGEKAGSETATLTSLQVRAKQKGKSAAVGGQTIDNRQPYLGLRWCIALQGIYPSRN